jgi:hypothetical protein
LTRLRATVASFCPSGSSRERPRATPPSMRGR